MLKEIFSRKLNTTSKTVCNAIITLGDIDDSGKGKRFKSRFIQPGLAGYPGQYGNVLVRKETLDKSLNTIIGAPVIINHTNITEANADELRVGVISNAYYNEHDGWYWCEGVIWDETAQNLITDKKWSVSCSYDFLEQDDEGGTENNIPYDREFTKLNFVHLALVDNPRYERANIVFNSKTVENFNPYHNHEGKFCTSSEAKIKSLNDAFEKVKAGSDEEIIKNVRNDLEQYGGTNDVALIKGDSKGGVIHIDEKHHEDVSGIFKALVDGTIVKTVPDRKVFIDYNGYRAILSLDRFGNKKTWLLTGYKIKEASVDNSKVCTQSVSMQFKPTFSRQELGANASNNIINNIKDNYNPTGENMLNNVENENWKTLYDKNGEPYHVDLDDADKTEYKVKKTTVKRKDGKEREIEYLDKPPKGWKKDEGATTAPLGYDWYTNGKSLLKGERKSILVKDHSKIYNAKEQEMALLEELKKLINNVENDKGEKMDDKKEVKNEKVDKRKLIDEVGGILKGKVDEEVWRTVIGKLEKLSYNKSEAGTADNAEDDKDKKDEKKPCDNEKEEKDKDKEKEEKNKCNNSVENGKTDFFAKLNEVYNSALEPPKEATYISQADRLEAANEYFGASK